MSNYWLSAIRTLLIFSVGVGMTVFAYNTTYPTPQSCSVAGCGAAIEPPWPSIIPGTTVEVIDIQGTGVGCSIHPDTVYVVDTLFSYIRVDGNPTGEYWSLDDVTLIRKSDAEKWAPFENPSRTSIDYGDSILPISPFVGLRTRSSINKLCCKSSGRCNGLGKDDK